MAKYRMTAKRRSALRKAQLASAKKRRRRTIKRVGIGLGVAGLVGAGVAGYGARSYVRHLASGGPRRPSGPSAFNPTHQLALPRGTSVTKVKKPKRGIHNRPGVFKVTPAGEAVYIRHPRPLYDRRRRRGLEVGYEKKVRGKYSKNSARTQRRRKQKRG